MGNSCIFIHCSDYADTVGNFHPGVMYVMYMMILLLLVYVYLEPNVLDVVIPNMEMTQAFLFTIQGGQR